MRCAARSIVVRPERFLDQLLEPVHLLRLTPQLIVETQHLRDEAGPNPECQAADAARRGASRRLRHHVAFERAQPARRIAEARMQPVVQFVARDHRRFERALQQPGGAARRDNNQTAVRARGANFGVRGAVNRERRNRVPEGLEFWDANEARPARSDHLGSGGFSEV